MKRSKPLQKPATLRHQFAWLVLAAVLPVWLVSGLLVYHAYTAKRDEAIRGMQQTARSLAMVVDALSCKHCHETYRQEKAKK